MLSGWNCTPSTGRSRWRMPITSPASVSDTTSNLYFLTTSSFSPVGAWAGSGGTGDFRGVWSDPTGVTSAGAGSLSFHLANGSNLTLSTSFGKCFRLGP